MNSQLRHWENLKRLTKIYDNVLAAEMKANPTQTIHQLTEKLNQSDSKVHGHGFKDWR